MSQITRNTCDQCHTETMDRFAVPGWIEISGGVSVYDGRETDGPNKGAVKSHLSWSGNWANIRGNLEFCGTKCLSDWLAVSDRERRARP